jgi:acetyl esterase/lipase
MDWRHEFMMLPLWSEKAPMMKENLEEDTTPHFIHYPVKSKLPTSAVIVLPGGGYQRRAEHEGDPVAKWLNGLGIAAFVLHYRVSPYRHPVPLMDAQRMIRYVRSHADEWNIDSNRIGTLGFSAGGHLAATAGTCFDEGNKSAKDIIERVSSRPDLMILCYPVISFLNAVHEGSVRNLLGEPTYQDRSRLSNERNVTSQTPPTFLWHTSDDAAVSVENSIEFALALKRCDVPFELHSFESGSHGLGLAQEHPEAYAWTGLCEKWLAKQGF